MPSSVAALQILFYFIFNFISSTSIIFQDANLRNGSRPGMAEIRWKLVWSEDRTPHGSAGKVEYREETLAEGQVILS